MKVEKTKEVYICDVCHRETTYLQTCISCGKEFCLTCDALIARCWVKPRVCKECASKDNVIKITLDYASKITPIIEERDKELRNLNK